MRRQFLILAAAVGVLAVSGGAVAADSTGRGGRSMTVVERATTDTVIHIGGGMPTGGGPGCTTDPTPCDSIGDQLIFGNDIYDRTNKRMIGRDQGVCIRTNPGLAWECTWTTILAKGSLTVQGAFYDDGRDSQLAITGGTGDYRNARGQMTIHARNTDGTEYDFKFRIIGG
jgi:hypothetical protein